MVGPTEHPPRNLAGIVAATAYVEDRLLGRLTATQVAVGDIENHQPALVEVSVQRSQTRKLIALFDQQSE